MPIIFSEEIPNILEKVHPSWKKLFVKGKFSETFNKALAALNNDLISKGVTSDNIIKNKLKEYIRPAPKDILRAFQYFDINNTRVIVVGQDPYPKKGEACGLSFSTDEPTVPMSLKKGVYPALKESKLIDYIPDHGNLEEYAAQGILMLNTSLTRTPEITKDEKGVSVNGPGSTNTKNIHKFWKEFTFGIVNYITSRNLHTDHKIPVILWGTHAKKVESAVGPNGVVLTWNHPSPRIAMSITNPEHFIHCDNFIKANEILRNQGLPEINWNPDIENQRILVNQFATARLLGKNITELVAGLIESGKIYNDLSGSEENKIIKSYMDNGKNPEILQTLQTLQISETPKQLSETSKTDEQISEISIPVDTPVAAQSSPEIDNIVIFTDGGCKGNGKDDAVGGIGVYIPASFNSISNGYLSASEPLSSTKIYGPLPKVALSLNKNREMVLSTKETKSTNQRAELLAVVLGLERVVKKLKAMKAERLAAEEKPTQETDSTQEAEQQAVQEAVPETKISEQDVIKPIILVTDSEYAIKWVSYLLWDKMIENPKFDESIANRDLVIMLYHSLTAIYKIYSGTITGTPVEKRDLLIGKQASAAWKTYASKPKFNKPPTYNPNWPGISVIHVESLHGKPGVLPKTNYIQGSKEDAFDVLTELKDGNTEADILTEKGLGVEDFCEDVEVLSLDS